MFFPHRKSHITCFHCYICGKKFKTKCYMRKHFTAYKQEPDGALLNIFFYEYLLKIWFRNAKKVTVLQKNFIYWLGYMWYQEVLDIVNPEFDSSHSKKKYTYIKQKCTSSEVRTWTMTSYICFWCCVSRKPKSKAATSQASWAVQRRPAAAASLKAWQSFSVRL